MLMKEPEQHQCRWIIGNPKGGGAFCESKMLKWPYCEKHLKIAHDNPLNKKTAQGIVVYEIAGLPNEPEIKILVTASVKEGYEESKN